jgi:translation initiation factor 2B subunit (eIF-2B alpha/beta/delta family)
MLEADSETKKLEIYEDLIQNTQACDKRLADLNPETVVVGKLHREVIEIRKINLSMSTKVHDLIKNGGELSRDEAMELERATKEIFGRLGAWIEELENISSKHDVPLDKEKWDSLDL